MIVSHDASWPGTAAVLLVLKAEPFNLQDVQKAAIVSQQAAAQLDQLVAGTITQQDFSDATSSNAVQVSHDCRPVELQGPISMSYSTARACGHECCFEHSGGDQLLSLR